MKGVCFVHMPFAQLGHPAMALSVLAGECRAHAVPTTLLYGNLRLAAQCSLKKYLNFAQYLSYFTLVGELLFKPYAGFSDEYQARDYFDYVAGQLRNSGQSEEILESMMAAYKELEPLAADFIEQLSDDIIATGCAAVGCDITYDQRNASLAILKRVKEKNPAIATMLGGNSCTGESGQALVDFAPQVDYLFSGEADDIIVPVLRLIESGATAAAINLAYPSVLIAGSTVCSRARASLEENTIPDFHDYFQELETLQFTDIIKPCLLIEGSRGCWWGAKQRCSFCGIHTSKETLAYRYKSTHKVVAELKQQSELYNIKSFVFTDCILSQQHVQELPQYLNAQDGWHLFAEVKSNLTMQQLASLRQAGFTTLQPGIESLQDDLLQLMNKGNRAIKHIELLKHARTQGMYLIWNMLHCLPYEQVSYYEEMNELLPWLTHLQPPVHINKVIFQKNSRYTQDSAKYGLQLQPLHPYCFVGDWGQDFLARSAEYYQDHSGQLKPSPEMLAIINKLTNNLLEWVKGFKDSNGDRLTMYEQGDRLEILDLRTNALRPTYQLEGSEKKIFLAATSTIALRDLREQFAYLAEQEFRASVDALAQQHLIVQVGDEILSLATPQPSLSYTFEPLLPVGRIILGDD